MAGLFVPGLGATAGLYAGLPEGWEALELPAFRETRGELDAYRRHLAGVLERQTAPVALAGHSLGGALALLAAAARPELVDRLVVLSPAGLPLEKPMRASAVTFAGQVARGRYPARELARVVSRAAAAPLAALRLARAAHDLDLSAELEPLRERGVPCTVVACRSDSLVTPALCRRLAAVLGADYRELGSRDGHIWPITEPGRLRAELSR